MIETSEFPQILYNIRVDPRFTDMEIAYTEFLSGKEMEMNCRTYALFLTWARGYTEVPKEYGSFHWFEDPSKVATPIHLINNIQDGDILGFSRDNEINMLNLHVGVAKVDTDGNIKVIHASRLAGGVIITPLDQMHLDPRHVRLYMIRRPNQQKFSVNEDALKKLGWYSV